MSNSQPCPTLSNPVPNPVPDRVQAGGDYNPVPPYIVGGRVVVPAGRTGGDLSPAGLGQGQGRPNNPPDEEAAFEPCQDCGGPGAVPKSYQGLGQHPRPVLCGPCARRRVALAELAGPPRPCEHVRCGEPTNLLVLVDNRFGRRLERRCELHLFGHQPYGLPDWRPPPAPPQPLTATTFPQPKAKA